MRQRPVAGASRSGLKRRAPRDAEWHQYLVSQRRDRYRRGCAALSLALKVRRRGRSDNSGDAEAGAATTIGLRPPFVAAPASASISVWSMGMSEMILPHRQV